MKASVLGAEPLCVASMSIVKAAPAAAAYGSERVGRSQAALSAELAHTVRTVGLPQPFTVERLLVLTSKNQPGTGLLTLA